MNFRSNDIGIIIGGIAVFFFIRLIVGVLASRRINSAADYIVAGRRLPIYFTAASIMATWFAAETIMGASATAYLYGLQGVVFDPFGSVLCLGLSGFFFIRILRRAQYMTAIDFFQKRFGTAMAAAGAAAQVIAYLGWTAAQIVAGGALIHALLGWPLPIGLIFVTTVVVLYTMMGGMWADTLLDFMQMFFTAGGILLIFTVVMKEIGGWQIFRETAEAMYVSDAMAILPIRGEGFLGYTGVTGWIYWIAAWLAIGLGSLPAQDLMQRSMSAKNEATAVHGTYSAGFLYGFFGIMSPLIGIALFTLMPGIAPEQTEYLIISASLKYLSPYLAALFIAALASALMSTSDSSLLAGASIISENILPLLHKNPDEKQTLLWTRVFVAIMGVCSLLLALFAATIYKLAIFAWTVLLVGQVVPFILGIYWKKANSQGALAGYAGGFISWIVFLLLFLPVTREINPGDLETALWDAAYISSVPAVLVSLITMVVVSIRTQARCPALPLRDAKDTVIEARSRLGILPIKDIF